MIRILLGSAALLVLVALPRSAGAETVTSNTVVTQIDIPSTRKIDFNAFDINHDGVLSRWEVGEELFHVFDLDGNEVIDNKEYKKKTVLTLIPMKSETEVAYDFDDDGKADETKYTYGTFTEMSGLARFAKSPGGLSPEDFAGKSFLEMDVNNDGVIDVKEWKGAYIASLDKSNKEAARVNQ